MRKLTAVVAVAWGLLAASAALAAGEGITLGGDLESPSEGRGQRPGYTGSVTVETGSTTGPEVGAGGGTGVVVQWVSWKGLSAGPSGGDCTLTRWATRTDLLVNGNAGRLYDETVAAWNAYLNSLRNAAAAAAQRAYDDVIAASADPTSPATLADAAAAAAAAQASSAYAPPPPCAREVVLDSSIAEVAARAFAGSLTPPAPHIAPDGTALTGMPAYLETRRPVVQTRVHDLALPTGTVRADVTGTVTWWVDWDHPAGATTMRTSAPTIAGPFGFEGEPWDRSGPDSSRQVWWTYQSSARDVTVAILDRWSVTATAPGFGTVGPVQLADHLTTYSLDIRQAQVVRTD